MPTYRSRQVNVASPEELELLGLEIALALSHLPRLGVGLTGIAIRLGRVEYTTTLAVDPDQLAHLNLIV